MHLAELNIAYPKFANDDPRFAGFMDNPKLRKGNGLASFGCAHFRGIETDEF